MPGRGGWHCKVAARWQVERGASRPLCTWAAAGAGAHASLVWTAGAHCKEALRCARSVVALRPRRTHLVISNCMRRC